MIQLKKPTKKQIKIAAAWLSPDGNSRLDRKVAGDLVANIDDRRDSVAIPQNSSKSKPSV
jgi:hypothetical protein